MQLRQVRGRGQVGRLVRLGKGNGFDDDKVAPVDALKLGLGLLLLLLLVGLLLLLELDVLAPLLGAREDVELVDHVLLELGHLLLLELAALAAQAAGS